MAEETKNTIIDGVDLSKLTSDQLLALTKEEWQEVEAVFKAAVAAKQAEAKAAFKEKLSKVIVAANTYVLPAIKYAAGAAVVLKVFGAI